ncbi:MAG TPA: nitroreductase/quinone reductase family protein [Candidatus Limnocylindrales bacterium]|nr:nitroreductase/quinone reductase family protein [Candidatus Limnocylindrales bacterium]
MPQILVILGAIVLGFAALVTAFLLGWRAKSPLVLGPIIALSKRFMNPMQMKTAGTPGAYAGIIRHRGRVSGTAYETPVGIVVDGDAFLVALPYGSRAQWLRNVLAAGTATVVHEGRTYRVDAPELIPMAGVAGRFSTSDQGLFRWMRVDDCLRLRNLDHEAMAGRAA